jgi:hypothetical protein
MSDYFKTEAELEAIVRGFETCTTPAADFPHRSHLVVATWYLNGASRLEAIAKMRAGILNFADHYGIEGKYNETITLFWIILVERHLQKLASDLSLLDRANAVVEALADSRVMSEYYSKELLWSERAMREWVAPDLNSLDRSISRG